MISSTGVKINFGDMESEQTFKSREQQRKVQLGTGSMQHGGRTKETAISIGDSDPDSSSSFSSFNGFSMTGATK